MPFKPRKDTCGFLGCEDPRGDDSYMCPGHSEVLRPVREAMEKEEDPYGTRGTRPKNAPMCTVRGCRNPRAPGESMCADCRENSFWEDGEEG